MTGALTADMTERLSDLFVAVMHRDTSSLVRLLKTMPAIKRAAWQSRVFSLIH